MLKESIHDECSSWIVTISFKDIFDEFDFFTLNNNGLQCITVRQDLLILAD